ncbi:MAG: DUF7139 domain-containing protein [Methanobacteriota archaeon]
MKSAEAWAAHEQARADARASGREGPIDRMRTWMGQDEAAFSERRLHGSFTLYIAGGVLVLAAVALLVFGQTYPATRDLQTTRYFLREAGGAVAGAGTIVLFLGKLFALYTKRYMRLLGYAGALVSVVGVGGFLWAYPAHWGVPGVEDRSVPVAIVLTAGLALLVSATFAASVANLVLRSRVRGALWDTLGREPTDEEIDRDIEDALRKHRYTWGGIAVHQGEKGIRFKDEPIPREWEEIRWKLGREFDATDTRAFDAAKRQLDAFRGGRMRTGDLDLAGLDTNADSLRALRAALAAKEADRPWNRFKAWLHRLFDRLLAALHIKHPAP